jgi:osmotically-inducible protein OsmY
VDGVVSLRGELPDEAQHGFTLTAARSVDGVKKVNDLIRITS